MLVYQMVRLFAVVNRYISEAMSLMLHSVADTIIPERYKQVNNYVLILSPHHQSPGLLCHVGRQAQVSIQVVAHKRENPLDSLNPMRGFRCMARYDGTNISQGRKTKF